MDELKLYKGIRIKVWKIENDTLSAGGYSIIRVDMFSEKLIKEMSGGEPFSCAYQDAEELAVLIDAELTLDGVIVRKSISGEYK
jgi:N-methylhydantoinase A/oxoprolinase/acetone carboxylase beta subunit